MVGLFVCPHERFPMKHFVRLFLIAAFLSLSSAAYALDVPRTPVTKAVGKAGVRWYVWSGLDGDDTGVPMNVANCAFLTVHVYSGTYGGSTVTFEGSNDPLVASSTEWVGLTDPQGTAISKAADGIEAVEEHPVWVRPKTASGTGADVAVGLTCIEQ